MSREERWVRLTTCESIPLREGRVAEIAGREIAVFNLGERFLAIENRCPHRGGPLGDGIVCGTVAVCPLHAWKIDLESGKAIQHPELETCLKRYRTRVNEGIVEIEVPFVETRREPMPATGDHQDRPLRWVQRRPLRSSSDGSTSSGITRA